MSCICKLLLAIETADLLIAAGVRSALRQDMHDRPNLYEQDVLGHKLYLTLGVALAFLDVPT